MRREWLVLVLFMLTVPSGPAYAFNFRNSRVVSCLVAHIKGVSEAGEGPYEPFQSNEVREEMGPTSEHYLIPNEFKFWKFRPALAGKTGVLLSVGTFRALNESVYGNFSYTILLDYDKQASAFNRVNLELIEKSNDRFEYLSNLFVGDTSLAESLRERRENPEAMIRLLESIRPSERVIEKWRGLGITLPPDSGKLDSANRETFTYQIAVLMRASDYNLLRAFRGFVNHGAFENNFFGSDEAYGKVRKDALLGKYVVLTGSLTGKKTIRAIGRTLEKWNLKVSALDMSNVWSYIQGNPRGARPTSPDRRGAHQFFKNMKSLPWEQNGKILYTEFTSWAAQAIEANVDRWNYFSEDYQKFLEQRRGSVH